jgi:hypothetical protein
MFVVIETKDGTLAQAAGNPTLTKVPAETGAEGERSRRGVVADHPVGARLPVGRIANGAVAGDSWVKLLPLSQWTATVPASVSATGAAALSIPAVVTARLPEAADLISLSVAGSSMLALIVAICPASVAAKFGSSPSAAASSFSVSSAPDAPATNASSAALTNAVLAIWVVLVPVDAVGAVGVPVKSGDASPALLAFSASISP